MGDHATEETQFVVDEVSNVIKEAIETTIGGNSYTHAKVNQWTNGVVESCLASLTKLQKPFKYIVTCVIMQVRFRHCNIFIMAIRAEHGCVGVQLDHHSRFPNCLPLTLNSL